MGRKYDREEIPKEFRDEAERIIAGEVTDGEVAQALRFNVDRYTMATWNRDLVKAVRVLRRHGVTMANVLLLTAFF